VGALEKKGWGYEVDEGRGFLWSQD